VSAYQLDDWADFAVASAGAAAALTGLLFVAVSINLKRILEFPQLPGRAAGTMGMLLTVLLVAVVLLAPGQPRQATGIEIAAMSAILAFEAILIARRARMSTSVIGSAGCSGRCSCCCCRPWP